MSPPRCAPAPLGAVVVALAIGCRSDAPPHARPASQPIDADRDAAPVVVACGATDPAVADAADDCAYTLRDLIRAIEATELRARGANHWVEGIDLHHTRFWGLAPGADGTWRVGWAS